MGQPRRWRARNGCLVIVLPLVLVTPAHGAATGPLELVQTIPLKGPAGRLDHLALDARHDRLFVANMANNSLDVVDLKAGKLMKQIPGQKGIQGIAYAPDLDRIFVGNGTGNVCNAFDGKTYRLLRGIELEDADNVRYDPSARRVYVTHADKALAVIDAINLKMLTDIKLPGPPEAFQLEKKRPRIYLNSPSPSQVVMIDRDRERVVRTCPLKRSGKNYPLALDEGGHRLFVGCRQRPMVLVLDADSGKERAAVPIPGDVDDLFFDARRKRVYASCGAGYLAVLEQTGKDRFRELARIPTAPLARTSLFDPDTGRLYVVLPRRPNRGGPEVRVYQARP